jgi:RNA polymerase sigma-70 factor (ECF subfamily)
MRITRNRETAEELTVDVFHDVWRRAQGYDPANGTVLGWIMNQARSRAIDRVRFENRQKRREPAPGAAMDEEATASRDAIEVRQEQRQLRSALEALSAGEREAIEVAYLSGLTYAETAMRLDQPLGTIKTRIRSALQKLRQALATEGGRP